MDHRDISESDSIAKIGTYIILLDKHEQVLLIRRGRTGYADGLLSLPSGNVEWGETGVDAAIREVREECGVQIVGKDLSLVHLLHRFKRSGDERIDLFFLCRSWNGVATNLEPDKHDHFTVVPLKQLPDDLIDYHRQGLDRALHNNFERLSWSAYGR